MVKKPSKIIEQLKAMNCLVAIVNEVSVRALDTISTRKDKKKPKEPKVKEE